MISNDPKYDFQPRLIGEAAQMIGNGLNRIIVQSPTGSGKSVIFASLIHRYLAKSRKRVVIACHRVKLVNQATSTLSRAYGIEAQRIFKETRHIHDKQVYVGMAETMFRRLSRDPYFLPEIGLLLCDEAHLGLFNKLLSHFPNVIVIGFTASPISAKKSDPVKNYYQDIVCGPQIEELIKIGVLAQNHTYSVKGINRKKFKIKGEDYDDKIMGDEFSKTRHVQNTIKEYRKWAAGAKTIIFNCNVDHSVIVTEAFNAAGIPCRHIDGYMDSSIITAAWEWFESTPDAVLCNVGIAVAGIDIPAIRTVIVNKSTTSLVSWLQMCGRGSRILPDKSHFTIIDMGGNARDDAHGDWSQTRDWHDLFHNPPKPREKLSAAPVKDCPGCEALIAAQAMTCKFCGYEFPRKEEQYDTKEVELVLITRNVDVARMVEANDGRKEYYTFFQIIQNLATQAKHRTKGNITQDQEEVVISVIKEKCGEWAQLKGIKWSAFHDKLIKENFDKIFGRSVSAAAPVTNGHAIRPIACIQPLITSNLEL